MDNEEDKDKIVASFALARMNMPTMQKKTFYLNKQEIKNIEDQITKYSAQYIIGKPEQIRVRLTPQGIEQYKRKLYSRPEKIDSLSSEDVYVFDCPHLQAFNYFFPFGANAEILSPEPLRERFIEAHKAALEKYK